MESKVALVTGGASGMGKAFSEILLEHKVKVCVSDIDQNLGEKTVSEFKQRFGEEQVCFSQCDVSDDDQLEGSFKKTMEQFGRLDIVVNNAGILNETNWKLMLSINLNALIQGCYLGIKYMGTNDGGNGGVIINTASVGGLMPCEIMPVYIASKFGVLGYTRSVGIVSKELYGIRLNALCPIFVDTPLMGKMKRDGMLSCPDSRERLSNYEQTLGMIRPGQVAEGLWKFIEDDSHSGQCMICGPEGNYLTSNLPSSYPDLLTAFTDYKA